MRAIALMRSIRGIQVGWLRAIFNRRNSTKQQKGQSVLEFVVVSSSILFFIFLFINLCYVFLVTQYIDYSVFMAARTLYASNHNPTIQRAFAQKTLTRMLRLNGPSIFGPLVKFITPPDQTIQFASYPNPKTGVQRVIGVRMEYEVPLFMIPPLGIIRAQDLDRLSRLRLVSETYLDREPSQDECYTYFEQFVDRHFPYLRGNNRQAILREASDNGC